MGEARLSSGVIFYWTDYGVGILLEKLLNAKHSGGLKTSALHLEVGLTLSSYTSGHIKDITPKILPSETVYTHTDFSLPCFLLPSSPSLYFFKGYIAV